MVYKVDNKDIWIIVSQKLYSLMKQGNTTTTLLFDVQTDSTGTHYINVDLDLLCPVFLDGNSTATLNEIASILGLSNQEKNRIKNNFTGNNFVTIEQVLPNILTPYTPTHTQLI